MKANQINKKNVKNYNLYFFVIRKSKREERKCYAQTVRIKYSKHNKIVKRLHQCNWRSDLRSGMRNRRGFRLLTN